MLRRFNIAVGLLLTLIATGGGLLIYYAEHSPLRKLEADLEAQRQRNAELKQVISRLEFEQRVAEIIVTKQSKSDSGQLFTTLHFVEYARDGATPLHARDFTIEGKRAHIDALVIKFENANVEAGDQLKGHSIGLFTRLFDEKHSPEQGFPIDDPQQEPDFYKGVDPRVPEYEKALWRDFWKLADDPKYAATQGVKLAQGESGWRDFDMGWLYTLKLQADGGLNIYPERMKAIYQDVLTNDATRPTTGQAASQP
jgi:hypothetical protein